MGVDEREGVVARPLALDYEWRFVVVVPEEELSTVGARRVLPERVPFADAVRNLSAMGLLLAGLADHDAFVESAMDDYLHQPYRMGLLAFAEPLLATLRESGAAGRVGRGPVLPCWDSRPRTRPRASPRRRERFSTTRASPASCMCSKPTGPAW